MDADVLGLEALDLSGEAVALPDDLPDLDQQGVESGVNVTARPGPRAASPGTARSFLAFNTSPPPPDAFFILA